MENETITTEQNIDNATLLDALAENPEAAHFLADLVAGGDARQLAIEHFGLTDLQAEQSPAQEPDATEEEPSPLSTLHSPLSEEIGMFQSAPLLNRDINPPQSEPTFLANLRPRFWDMFN